MMVFAGIGKRHLADPAHSPISLRDLQFGPRLVGDAVRLAYLIGSSAEFVGNFRHRTDHYPTDGADRVVRSITEPIANEHSERPFDRGSDANDPREARRAVGR